MKVGVTSTNFLVPLKKFFPEISLATTWEEYDLIIFSHGFDIEPYQYDARHKFSIFDLDIDNKEKNIYRYFYENTYFFGINRGFQLFAALNGVQLVQDLYLEKNIIHKHTHSLEFNDSYSFLSRIFPSEVNSIHHQGIDLNHFNNFTFNYNSDKFITLAQHGGIAEIGIFGSKILGVQYNPELMNDEKTFNFVKFAVRNQFSFTELIELIRKGNVNDKDINNQ